MEYFLSVMNGFSLVNERFLITGECFLSVIEGFFSSVAEKFPICCENNFIGCLKIVYPWMKVFSSLVEKFLTGGDLFYPLKDSSEKAFGARNKISCHFIEPFTFIFLHLLGGFGRKTPSVLLFSGLFPSVWCILGLSSFSRFSYFQDGFSFVPKFLPEICGAWTFVFLESGRSFAVPFPVFSVIFPVLPASFPFSTCCFRCFPVQLFPFSRIF